MDLSGYSAVSATITSALVTQCRSQKVTFAGVSTSWDVQHMFRNMTIDHDEKTLRLSYPMFSARLLQDLTISAMSISTVAGR